NRASRTAAGAASAAASAAGGAALAAADARRAANAAASDRRRAAEARQRAEEARNAAAGAQRAAQAAEHAGAASNAADEASEAARSASANANAAAGSADKAGNLASAAGASSQQAQAAADQARRQAREADRAATASSNLARQATQAAHQARDAARSAATHAQNAATAADQAAEHAGESATSAAEATRQAEAARAAAATASAAVATAGTVYDLARRTESEDLTARTAAGLEEARALKAEEDVATGGIGVLLADWKILEQEAADLAAEAARPDADPKAVAAKGRKAALHAAKAGGPWSQEAAKAALSGTDETVVDWARTGRRKAELDDMRQNVVELAQDSPDEAVRTAATTALKGTPQQIEAFFTTGQHEAAITDNRIRAYQVIATGGTSVKEAGEAALRDGSPHAVAAFLMTGQYTARRIDERVEATQMLAAGGPEVQAAAKLALAGPPGLVTSFLQTDRYMADRKDLLAATHAEQMRHLIAEAAQAAAKAQQDAWEATAAAAIANNAAAEAQTASTQARSHADQAARYAADANTAAHNAEASATRAGQSATTARTAANAAARDAGKATASATRASASAAHARWSATRARTAADNAYASARAAGQDADAAQQAADQAWDIAITKASQERQAELAAEEEGIQAEAAQIEEALKKELEALIQSEATEAEHEYSSANKKPCSHRFSSLRCFLNIPNGPITNGLLDMLDDVTEFFKGVQDKAQLFKKVFKMVLGFDSAEECIRNKSAAACAELAVSFFPAGKAAKLAQLARKARDVEDAARAARVRRIANDCLKPNSFPVGTRVLMADGTTLPIERIRVGDQVWATDPESGEAGGRRVDATIYTPEDRKFTDLTIASTDGPTGTLTATEHHPFWVEKDRKWVDAGNLNRGDTLRTPDGQTADVIEVRNRSGLNAAYNLTIQGLHTYYVLAGTAPVLVHNSGLCTKKIDDVFYNPSGRTSQEQFEYHWDKHAKKRGITREQYLQDTQDWATEIAQPGGKKWLNATRETLADGTQGVKYVHPQTGRGGLIGPDGKPVSFWYDFERDRAIVGFHGELRPLAILAVSRPAPR
ncbi:polymorphic toxin-type HINT domain-containing protein, partial [Kitasatospora sp. NPDC059463]|uniref:polymorphic toxin-type HINT domain-containing protein n=1 Tax=Kitasatospora sp. NPDC059463 TaxID=3346842 RepID=UPI0036C8E35D